MYQEQPPRPIHRGPRTWDDDRIIWSVSSSGSGMRRESWRLSSSSSHVSRCASKSTRATVDALADRVERIKVSSDPFPRHPNPRHPLLEDRDPPRPLPVDGLKGAVHRQELVSRSVIGNVVRFENGVPVWMRVPALRHFLVDILYQMVSLFTFENVGRLPPRLGGHLFDGFVFVVSNSFF